MRRLLWRHCAWAKNKFNLVRRRGAEAPVLAGAEDEPAETPALAAQQHQLVLVLNSDTDNRRFVKARPLSYCTEEESDVPYPLREDVDAYELKYVAFSNPA